MSVKAAMARELDIVSKALNETVETLEGKVAPDDRTEFRYKKSNVREVFEQKKRIVYALKDQGTPMSVDVTPALLCTHIDTLALPLHGKLDEPEKQRLRFLRNQSERLDRKIQLLHPASEQEFIGSLYWMSQRGSDKDLDFLFKIRAKPPFTSDEAWLALRVAEHGIIKRQYTDLYLFFDLSPHQFARVIEATIAQCRAVISANLKKAFNAGRPTQVTNRLKEIKATLEDLFEPPRIKQWLNTPLEPFEGQTPRQALLEGKTFPVLHLLKRFDEGSHY